MIREKYCFKVTLPPEDFGRCTYLSTELGFDVRGEVIFVVADNAGDVARIFYGAESIERIGAGITIPSSYGSDDD